MNLESPIIRQGNKCTGNHTNKLLIGAPFSPLSIWHLGLDRPRGELGMLWHSGWHCLGRALGLPAGEGAHRCSQGQSSAWLGKAAHTLGLEGALGAGMLRVCHLPGAGSPVSIPRCEASGEPNGSPGKRAVRTNPGGLVSPRLCRVRERWLFHEFLQKAANLPSVCPAWSEFTSFGHCFSVLLKRKQISQFGRKKLL